LEQTTADEIIKMQTQQNERPDHDGKVASAVEARQGVISGRVVLVLLTSLLLAVIALAVSFHLMHD
jgi:hypothetical protein